MTSPIQVGNKDISLLRDHELVQVLWQLVNLELSTNGIGRYDSQVSLSIYAKDGGIDGLARWDEGPSKTQFLPSRHVGFQAKATDMDESSCKAEVKTKTGLLKPQVRKLSEAGGTYVLFLGRDCNTNSKEPRIRALREGIEEAAKAGGERPLAAPAIMIFDASDIAAWVNAYPATVTTVLTFLGRQSGGAKSWLELAGYPAFQIPYVKEDQSRADAIQALRENAYAPRKTLRLFGPSGLGKTRLVVEAFRPPAEDDPASAPDQQCIASNFCYVSAADSSSVSQMVLDWRRLDCRGTVIVDDCPFELHEKLAQEVRRTDSKLCLISIGNDLDPTAYAGTDTRLVAVRPTTDQAIASLLDLSFGEIREEDRQFIATVLAQGYPLMAILVAQARKANAQLSARLTPDVLTRLLGRPVARGSTAEKVISVCSLFDYLGITGDVSHEREFARTLFCPEISREDFYASIVDFIASGALSSYGRVVQVRPMPLAIRLAADWWGRCTPEMAQHVIGSNFPAGLASAFCQRLRMLDFVPALVEVTTQLCGAQGPFGQAKVLNSDLGSQLFRAIAEVNPDAAVGALSRALQHLSEEELEKQITGEPRRNLVWSLEKLCFRRDTFLRAAGVLLQLAAGENETWSNNATGVFKRLFMILLPGTQASLEERLPVLRRAAADVSARVRKVAVAALDNALRADQFSATAGAEYQGSQGPLPQYRPSLWKEVFDYWNACIEELTRLAMRDSETSDDALRAIARNIRGLVAKGRLDALEAAISTIARAKQAVWPDALDSIKDSLRFEGKDFSDDDRRRIESWLTYLEPNDLKGKLTLHVTNAPHEHEEDSLGHWRDLAAERAESLGIQCGEEWQFFQTLLPNVLVGAQQQAYMFGRGLAKGAMYSDDKFRQIEAVLASIPFDERNSSVVSGWLSALDEADSTRADFLFKELATEQPNDLRQSLPAIARGIKLNDSRVDELGRLLKAAVLTPPQLYGLSHGQAMNAVSPQSVTDLMRDLLARGVEGAWIALDVGFFYTYSDGPKWMAIAPTFKVVLLTPGMLSQKPGSRADGHAFSKVAEKLLPDDAEFASVLVNEVLDAALQVKGATRRDEESLREVLEAMLKYQLAAIWPALTAKLESSSGIQRMVLNSLIGSRLRTPAKVGLLDKVPLSMLADWCAKAPEAAPPVLAGLIQPLREIEPGWELSETAMLLLDRYGDQASVLSALGANVGTFTWSGSLVPYYEGLASALKPLEQHRISNVRMWAERFVHSLREQAERERERDAEQREYGRYS